MNKKYIDYLQLHTAWLPLKHNYCIAVSSNCGFFMHQQHSISRFITFWTRFDDFIAYLIVWSRIFRTLVQRLDGFVRPIFPPLTQMSCGFNKLLPYNRSLFSYFFSSFFISYPSHLVLRNCCSEMTLFHKCGVEN